MPRKRKTKQAYRHFYTEAYTLKADGRKVKVSADQIKEQQEKASVEAPMFQDSLVKVVIFPEVAVGDRLVLHYQRHRTTPLFPGQFEDLSAPDYYQQETVTFTYDMPADMPTSKASRPQRPTQRKDARSTAGSCYRPKKPWS